jgi:phosphatidylglycerol:prolipoprotein diacylglycerol transferase
MPVFAIPFPVFDPVLVSIGPLSIRWYALAYIGGLIIGNWLCLRLSATPSLWGQRIPPSEALVDDMLLYAALGVVLGGRLGYVLFYNPVYYLANPQEIIAVWRGGMAFHGGLAGAALGVWYFARRTQVSALTVADICSAVVPIGLCLGRIANFIKPELWGRESDVAWAMVFPDAGPLPRHPSQLYEAALEGALLFVLLQIALRVFRAQEKPGLVSALFFLGYGTFRFICEFYREPDTQFIGPVSMGMALSVPVWLTAAALFAIALRKKPA